jgi:hypothetical protein
MSSNNGLLEAALHVLVAWTSGEPPAEPDLLLLKTAFPASAHLPDDELACIAVHELGGRKLPEFTTNRNSTAYIREVA